MNAVLHEPVVMASVITVFGVIFTASMGYLQQRKVRRAKFYKSNLSMDEKKIRLLRWNQEHYHRARMLMIQNNLGHLVDTYLPFDPPRDLMIDDSREEG